MGEPGAQAHGDGVVRDLLARGALCARSYTPHNLPVQQYPITPIERIFRLRGSR
jgi:hypothetical protein